mgnify:CR=1 FL=1
MAGRGMSGLDDVTRMEANRRPRAERARPGVGGTERSPMHALVTRRRMNPARIAKTRQTAEANYWPKLRQTPGFVSFTLIQGEDGVNTVVTIFETSEQLEAFRREQAGWARTLDEHGHYLETQTVGGVAQHLTAEAAPRPGQACSEAAAG